MTAARPAVALVGAGPGDPELLTLRAEALLGQARVVVVDACVSAIAHRFAGSGQVVVVPDDRPAVPVLLAALAGTAGPLVRLYRGDPWLHPAHETERAAMAAAGIAAEAVAGVAVEVALPALAGVPVHVRQLAVACTFGPYGSLPAATESARTLVASSQDPVTMARAVAKTGDGRLPVALVPADDPATAWRGVLAGADEAAAAMTGSVLLVVGAVCDGHPDPAVGRAPK